MAYDDTVFSSLGDGLNDPFLLQQKVSLGRLEDRGAKQRTAKGKRDALPGAVI